MDSIGLYGPSPFIYPVYGIGGIPEGFSRLCAIYGGTYMLNTPVDSLEYSDDGKVVGVMLGDQIVRSSMILCDPSYAMNESKVRSTGHVVRAICILDHPIPKTDRMNSCQIILPQR